MSDAIMLWNWTSPVWLVAIAALAAYWLKFGMESLQRWIALLSGLALLVLAYVSPIGVLADGYLFSAHMVQHLVLLLLIPLCLLLALPKERVAKWFDSKRMGRIGSLMSIATIGWISGVGAMWLWHVPALCTASTQNHLLGSFRDATFLAAGLLFWWPIYAPVERYRLPPLTGIAYLFSACLGCTLLGIYITFTTITVCPAFANPANRIGILNMLYDAGFTPAVDQELGGLLMWVPPCSLYVAASISLLCRWYSTMEEHPQILPELTSNRGQATL
jgi:putative membrane protein